MDNQIKDWKAKNDTLWHMTWYQSRRGGHYIFEVAKEDEDESIDNG